MINEYTCKGLIDIHVAVVGFVIFASKEAIIAVYR